MTVQIVAPTVAGRRASLTPVGHGDLEDLLDLDWHRSLHPAMAGWSPRTQANPGTALIRPASTPDPVGVLDAQPLPGYDDVVNLSIYTDTAQARGGVALEAYGLYVESLFTQGARLIHHEILALNAPILRVLRGIRLQPTARLREHAYAAGRWWDVLVFSYDETHWRSTLDRLPRHPFAR